MWMSSLFYTNTENYINNQSHRYIGIYKLASKLNLYCTHDQKYNLLNSTYNYIVHFIGRHSTYFIIQLRKEGKNELLVLFRFDPMQEKIYKGLTVHKFNQAGS